MSASSTVVIKVKHGDLLRRFNAPVFDDKLGLNMDGLRKKIISLFGFAPDADLMLTYVDEDDDVVALVEDDDLCDVVKQDLNPLRITVKLNGEKSGAQFDNSTASSIHSRLPIAVIPEILSKVREPLHGALAKLSDDYAKASASPVIADLVDLLSKVGLSYLAEPSGLQAEVKATSVPSSSTAATEPKNTDHLQKPIPEASVESNEVKSTTGKNTKSSSFDFNAVASALGRNIPDLAQMQAEAALEQEVFKKFLTRGKGVCKPNDPKLGANSGNTRASDPSKVQVNNNAKWFAKGWAPPPPPPMEALGCPFSGGSMGVISAPPPPNPSFDQFPSKGNVNPNDGSGNIFHRGVRCDGCGVHPIVGPRFNSKVRLDYDLCRICFEEVGNFNDYIRMDRPTFLPPIYFKGLQDARAKHQLHHAYRGARSKPGALKLDSRFIQDVNIFDGTVMAPSTPFTKIWRMRNNGTLSWPQKTQLVWIGGDKLSHALSVEIQQLSSTGLPTENELDVAVDFIAPELPGRYISYWRMASPSGQKFGQRVWVLIQVDASLKETPKEIVRNLNLNLPPLGLTGPEIINCEPTVEDTRPVADSLFKTLDIGKPDADQELKFPINDSLLVGNGATTSISPSPSSLPFPMIDINVSDVDVVAPALPTVSPSLPLVSVPPPPLPPPAEGSEGPSAVQPSAKDQVEEKLLRELEEMGFKQVDLNKEVLRLNEYDLEQAVDDLCGVAEWDPILEELYEMGFDDTETNKKLLKKNKGSIKRVVMDLIAGEK